MEDYLGSVGRNILLASQYLSEIEANKSEWYYHLTKEEFQELIDRQFVNEGTGSWDCEPYVVFGLELVVVKRYG